jgi:hypothetical protein
MGIIVPIFFFICAAGVWGSYIFTRHRERMVMIEKGLKSDEIKSLYEKGSFRFNPLSSLKWGMIFIGIGIAVLLGSYLHENYMMNESVFPGLIALFGGLGLFIFYFVAHRKVQG